MIWDFCPDMMHIIKTFWERLVLGVFSGKREPTFTPKAPVKPKTNEDAEEVKAFKLKKRKYDEAKTEWTKDCAAFKECHFEEHDRKVVDVRVQNLVGYPYWIRSTLVSAHSTSYIHNILGLLWYKTNILM